MLRVSRRECRFSGGDDSGNQRVTDLYRSTGTAQLRCQDARRLCCAVIEWKNPALQVLLKGSGEGFFELTPSSARREECQPEPDLKHGDGRGPDG